MASKSLYLIGLDIGTSAIKGALLSAAGSIVATARQETRYLPSAAGYIEFDADQLYASAAFVIRSLVAALPDHECECVKAVGIASAGGNTVLVDERGTPLRPAISWMDSRFRDETASIFGNLDGRMVHELTGWPLLAQFPLAHLSWLKVHEPELLAHAARICMSADYVLFRLTGNWGIDRSTATTFYLQDQQAAAWHVPWLRTLGIPIEKLPPIHASGAVLGTVTPGAAAETGLPAGCSAVLGAFDHPCAARGAGVLEEGQLLLSCGTSWVGFAPVADRRKAVGEGLLTDPFLQPAGPWGAMFSLPTIAASVDRYVTRYISAAPDRYREFDSLSAASVPGAGGLFVHPALDDAANGDLRGHERAHIARAVMEGTAFLLRRQLERLEAAGWRFSSATMVGGPSETHPWPQIVADVLGRNIVTANGSCAGAVGAAILAGMGTGMYSGEQAAFRSLRVPKVVRTPSPAAQSVYEKLYLLFQNKYDPDRTGGDGE